MKLAGQPLGVGAIRAFLAISVYIWHENHGIFGYRGPDGQTAVEGFFIISGFYMFMILDGSYRSPWLFLSNRWLRLYPGYLAVLAATVVVLGAARAWTGDWACPDVHYCGALYEAERSGAALSTGTVLFALVANLGLLFQDLTFYLGIDAAGSMYWVFSFKDAPPPHLWKFMGLPQAWSLSVELYFYALMLVMHRWRSRTLVLVVLAGAAAKLWIHVQDIPDPWVDKAFPVEVMMFALGGLAYRAYRDRPAPAAATAAAVAWAVALVSVLFFLIPGPGPVKTYGFCLMLALALPALFRHSASSVLDRRIGDLSYPIYLTHQLVIFLLPFLFRGGWIDRRGGLPALGLGLTVASAWAVWRWIDQPVDRLRQRRKASADAVGAEPAECPA